MPIRLRPNSIHDTHATPAIPRVVTVEHLPVEPIILHLQPIIPSHHRSEITHKHDLLPAPFREAQERDHRVLNIVQIHPLEPVPMEVDFIQRGLIRVQPVEIAHQRLQPSMEGKIQQIPRHAGLVIPLRRLPDLTSHEQQLLAGMAIHVAQERAYVRKPPPLVAGHFTNQRRLAMHHFVMRNRQQEVLRKRVNQAECHAVVVVLAINRVRAEVLEHVVHPAHVPLHREAEPA